MLTPMPQQDAGHLDQPQVVGSLLVVTYQYGPAFRQPAQCTFHHPTPRRIAFHTRIIEFLLADLADVRDVAPLFDDLPRCWRFVVALVQAQVLITRRLFGGSGPFDHEMASSVASNSLKSGTFAPAITTERGPPSASTSRERLTPFLALSVGLGPTRSPQSAPCPSPHRRPATRSPLRRVPRTPR